MVLLCGPAAATTVPELSLDQQVGQARLIVKGRVTATRNVLEGSVPHTEVTLAVEEIIKGQAGATVTFRMLGGDGPGDRRIVVEGAPRFNVGDHLCLLMTTGKVPIVGFNRGYYRLRGAFGEPEERVYDVSGQGVSGVDGRGRLLRTSVPARALRWGEFRDLLRAVGGQ